MRSVLTRHHRHHHTEHPRENSLAAGTIVGGLTAFAAGLAPPTHFLAVCVGIATFLFGLYSQLVSATTSERWFNVIGVGMAFVGVGLGLSHGGFRL